jgi:hypothetical protein
VDTHKHVQLYWELEPGTNASAQVATAKVKLGSSGTEYTIATKSGSDNGNDVFGYSGVFVVAKGSDEYDLYVGGRLMEAGISEAKPQLYFIAQIAADNRNSTTRTTIQIDNVRESSITIS